MIEYWQSLGIFEKVKCIAKLKTVGLSLEHNPHTKESEENFEMNVDYIYRLNSWDILIDMC